MQLVPSKEETKKSDRWGYTALGLGVAISSLQRYSTKLAYNRKAKEKNAPSRVRFKISFSFLDFGGGREFDRHGR